MRDDTLKTKDVEADFVGVYVVIQILGVGLVDLLHALHLFSGAPRVLIAEMRNQDVKRLIRVPGFGAGDSRASISFRQRLPFQIVFGRTYEDKSSQEKQVKQTDLDWTTVRPRVLTRGLRTGFFQILSEVSQYRNGIISRTHVAEFLVRQVGDRAFTREAPVMVN